MSKCVYYRALFVFNQKKNFYHLDTTTKKPGDFKVVAVVRRILVSAVPSLLRRNSALSPVDSEIFE